MIFFYKVFDESPDLVLRLVIWVSKKIFNFNLFLTKLESNLVLNQVQFHFHYTQSKIDIM
jgi:hypothetical protein